MSVIWSVDKKENYLISLSGQCALAGNRKKRKKKEKELSMMENRQNVTTVFVSSGSVT